MIGTCLLAAALQLGSAAPPASDPWFGADKVKHFFLSAFVNSVSYSTLRLTNLEHRSSMVGAVSISAAVGIAKEVADRRRGGVASVRDLAWDAAGVGASWVLLHQAR